MIKGYLSSIIFTLVAFSILCGTVLLLLLVSYARLNEPSIYSPSTTKPRFKEGKSAIVMEGRQRGSEYKFPSHLGVVKT